MSSWHGGKGAAYRPTDQKKFGDNWDRIFGKRPSPDDLPDADCDNCKYGGEYDGQHCYMFKDEPGDKCGQFNDKLKRGKK
jgi:hypothetical protein